MKTSSLPRFPILTAVILLVLISLLGCAGPNPQDTPASTIAPTGQSTDAPEPPTPSPQTAANPADPLVMIGNVSFTIELAETPEQLARGLSGRDSLDQGAGMLFVHESDERYTFWMKNMRFPLDLIWIDAGCIVADISAQVPAPEPGQSDRSLPLFSPETPVRHVLEINAGAAAESSISIGDDVKFAGSLEGRHGC